VHQLPAHPPVVVVCVDDYWCIRFDDRHHDAGILSKSDVLLVVDRLLPRINHPSLCDDFWSNVPRMKKGWAGVKKAVVRSEQPRPFVALESRTRTARELIHVHML
jgi:hypothetical protein